MRKIHIPGRTEVLQSLTLMAIRKLVDEDLAKPVQSITAVKINRILLELEENISGSSPHLPTEEAVATKA